MSRKCARHAPTSVVRLLRGRRRRSPCAAIDCRAQARTCLRRSRCLPETAAGLQSRSAGQGDLDGLPCALRVARRAACLASSHCLWVVARRTCLNDGNRPKAGSLGVAGRGGAS